MTSYWTQISQLIVPLIIFHSLCPWLKMIMRSWSTFNAKPLPGPLLIVDLLSILLETKFSEILVKIQKFWVKKYLKMLSTQWWPWPFCSGSKVSILNHSPMFSKDLPLSPYHLPYKSAENIQALDTEKDMYFSATTPPEFCWSYHL